MKMSETRELANARALARLNKALPEIFPAPVLTHALNRRWTPPMPRLAVDGYWRAHPLRADRLARALARRSGTPEGWTWRLKEGRKSDLPVSFRAPPAPFREKAFSRGPGFCCVCGQPVYRLGWHVDLWERGPNTNATWHTACVTAWRLWNAPSDYAKLIRRLQGRKCAADRRAAVEDLRSRPSRAAVPGVARAPRHGLAGAARVLGPAESADHQSRRSRGKMRRRGDIPAAHSRECTLEAI